MRFASKLVASRSTFIDLTESYCFGATLKCYFANFFRVVAANVSPPQSHHAVGIL